MFGQAEDITTIMYVHDVFQQNKWSYKTMTYLPNWCVSAAGGRYTQKRFCNITVLFVVV